MIRSVQRLFLLVLVMSLDNLPIKAMLRKTTTSKVTPWAGGLWGSQYGAFPWQTKQVWYMPSQESNKAIESNFDQNLEYPVVYEVGQPMYSVYKEYPEGYKVSSNFKNYPKYLYKKEFQEERKSDKKYSSSENSGYFFYGIDLRNFLKGAGIVGIISSMVMYLANNSDVITKPIEKMLEEEAEIEGTDLYNIKKLIDANDWNGLEVYLNDFFMRVEMSIQEKLTIEELLSLSDKKITPLKFISFLKARTDLINLVKIIIGTYYFVYSKTFFTGKYVDYVFDRVFSSKSENYKISHIENKLRDAIDFSDIDMFNFYINHAFKESDKDRMHIAENCIVSLIKQFPEEYEEADIKSYENRLNLLVNLGQKTDNSSTKEFIQMIIPIIQNLWLKEKLKKYIGLE